ncbi:O-antigen ligase family protein [Roseiflexus castenholzii]|jgi:O-antigen ligase|uniref:O-antigen polymerase n=1 Tax=Roseiflexus castenholzii (strain DSM 13941 / HLO8) TaxID=383372 RepID=A7NNL6_ROSCS|nr:O-antigen ligase family protein [Roseiflexus castenholzii]ABU59157.1 O-antigen polymerase [Roseiflexus castenholzii DSM 13941]
MYLERLLKNPMDVTAGLWRHVWFQVGVVVAVSIAAGMLVSRDVPLWLFFGGIAGIVVVAIAFIKPEYVAAALLVIHWGNIHDVLIKYHGIPSVVKLMVALLTVVLLARRFLSERPRGLVSDPVIWWMLAYLVVGATGLWFARDTDAVLSRLVDTAKDGVIAGLIFNLLSTRAAFERAVWGLLIVGAVLSALTVYQEMTKTYDNNYWGFAQAAVRQISTTMDDRARAFGTVNDPNYFGQLLLVLVPLAVWAILNGRTWRGKSFGMAALLLLLAAIGLTFSRGAYLGAVVVLVVYAMYLRLDARYLLILPLIGALLYVAPPEFRARFGTLDEVLPGNNAGAYADSSIQGRSVKAEVAIAIVADNPIFGVGRGNYRLHYRDYINEIEGAGSNTERDAHNLYLEVAAEQGIVGLVVFVGLLATVWGRLRAAELLFVAAGERRMADLSVAVKVGLLGYLVTSLFLHGAYGYMLWLQVGMAVALVVIAQREAAAHADHAVKASR